MTRINSWRSSAFADWLRGTDKGVAKTLDDWEKWEIEARQRHPVRYWLAEEALDKIQNFICWPLDKLHAIKYYINNRFVTKTHCLVASKQYIAPGEWRDLSDRFLPCMFGALVDYVEIELAAHQIIWNGDAKKYKAPFWASGWFRWRTWRCPAAGIDHLEWQASLVYTDLELDADDPRIGKPTPQAIDALEVLTLYRWWTEVYANRADPYEVSGWNEYCNLTAENNSGKLRWNNKESPELAKLRTRTYQQLRKIEKEYLREDEAMMIRLIKIRQSLWT